MKNNFFEISLVLVLVALLVALCDPFMLWMPGAVAMTVLIAAALLLIVWIGLVAQEKGGDEREVEHRERAGRFAYIAAVVTLMIAFVVQGFVTHTIDPWIMIALVVTLVTKLVARLYLDICR